MAECTICALASGRSRGLRLYEDERVVVVLGLLAGRPRDLLIVPRRHIASLDDLGDGLHAHLLETGQRATQSLGDAGIDLGKLDPELEAASDHVYLHLAATTPALQLS